MAESLKKFRNFWEAFHFYFRGGREGSRKYSSKQLEKMSRVKSTTIDNWIKKKVGRPNDWRDLVRLSRAIQLSLEDTNNFLTSSDHPTIENLQVISSKLEDKNLLAHWTKSDRKLKEAEKDQIEKLYNQFIPPELTEEDFDAYLNFLIQQNRLLTMPDQKKNQIELECIYVSLRADEIFFTERVYEGERAQNAMDSFLAEQIANAPYEASKSSYIYAIQQSGQPFLSLREERERSILGEHSKASQLNLAEAVNSHSAVVILGDPGAGKTTICQWLTLQFSRALLDKRASLSVPLDLIQQGVKVAPKVSKSSEAKKTLAESNSINFGQVRLPVFVSIIDYAHLRIKKRKDGTLRRIGLTLLQFLERGLFLDPNHLENNQIHLNAPRELVKRNLEAGTCLIILDGLDEVGNQDQRWEVMQEVSNFIDAMVEKNGNKLVMTSRIAGYHFSPLESVKHFRIDEMAQPAIEAFIHAWMSHVGKTHDPTQWTKS